MAHLGRLSQTKRYITAHDASGKSIISEAAGDEVTMTPVLGDMAFGLAFATSEAPVDMNGDKDFKDYQGYLQEPPGLVVQGGSIIRVVDIPPGSLSPMHRTVSVDYGIVIAGEVELILDSGDKRVMKHGDICVQRGTNHAWRNTSETEFARMIFVLLGAKSIVQDGKELGEDITGADGAIRAST